MSPIEEFLLMKSPFVNGSKEISHSPSEWQFDQMEKIADQYSVDSICDQIFNSYDPTKHNRHLVALIFSMLIWHSVEHERAVFKFFRNVELTDDKKMIGIVVSREIEWFPFETIEKTLEVISVLRNKYPEYKEDYEHWEGVAEAELKRRTAYK